MRTIYRLSSIMAIAAVSASVAVDYQAIRHDLLTRSHATVLADLTELKTDLDESIAASADRQLTQDKLARVVFDHLQVPGLFSAITTGGEHGQTLIVESSGLNDEARELVQHSPLSAARNTFENDDYLLFLVDSREQRQAVIGVEKSLIAAEAWQTTLYSALAAYAMTALLLLALIGLLRQKVEFPLRRFLRDGLRQALQNAMQGLPSGTITLPALPVVDDETDNPLRQTLKMIGSWGQHKSDVDQLIRVATMETDKRELAANVFRITSRSLPIQGFVFYEVNHSLNRLEPVYSQAAVDPNERLLDSPNACLVYRTGASLIQPAESPLCTACAINGAQPPQLCKTLIAGGNQVGICRFDVDPLGLDEWVDYLPDQHSRLALLDSMLAPFVHLLGLAVSNISLVETYKNSAITDALTGLYNRRYLVEYFSNILSLAKRSDSRLSVFMVDVDNFKRLNDEFGHKVGDMVLQTIAHTMNQTLRESDTLARYGGEEFIVVLPDTDSQTALSVAEKLRAAVETIDWQIYGYPNLPRTTISVGVAEFPLHGYSHYHLTNAADKALYQAKRQGRNQVAVHDHLPTAEQTPQQS